MSEALYRKYRPQIFEDVVGQEHIERTIKNAIGQDKVSHAYLFTGPRGTGKTTTARLLAKALLCEKGPTAEPDGTCNDCVAIANGEHPDVYDAGRRQPHGCGERARGDHRARAVRADARPLQGLYHRRGAHALHGGVQRAAEDAGGTTEPRGVHPVHHRSAEGAGNHPFPLPAVRLPPHFGRSHRVPPGSRVRGRRRGVRGRGAGSHRASCRRRHAQRPDLAGTIDRVRRRQGDHGGCRALAGVAGLERSGRHRARHRDARRGLVLPLDGGIRGNRRRPGAVRARSGRAHPQHVRAGAGRRRRGAGSGRVGAARAGRRACRCSVPTVWPACSACWATCRRS